MRLIVNMGMPGAGKTTLSTALAAHFDCPLITAGDIARQLAAIDPETAAALEKGQLAPRDKMNTAVRESLAELLNQRVGNVVVDGWPRYFEQLADLLLLAKSNDAYIAFVHVGCNDETAIKRLMSRKRDDDTEDAIKERIGTYWAETWPTITWLNTRINNAGLIHVPIGSPEYQLQYVTDSLGFTANHAE